MTEQGQTDLGCLTCFWEDGGRKPEQLVETHTNRGKYANYTQNKIETQDVFVVRPLCHCTNIKYIFKVVLLHLQILAN